MKEYDLSLLFFDVSSSGDCSDIEKITGEVAIKKMWAGSECVEVFLEGSTVTGDFPCVIEDFLKLPLVKDLLNIRKKKSLRVGVFFDTINCNLELTRNVISDLNKLDLEVIFSCYPSSSK